MSEYVHHYSKIQVNNVAKVRDWLQAGSLPKTSLPLQTSNEVDTQAQRMKTLSLNEACGRDLNSYAEDAFSKIKEDYLNELCSMFPNQNPHQLYQVLIKNQFNLQRAVESLLDIHKSSTKSQNIAKIGSSFSDNRAFTHSENAVCGITRTEPLHQLGTETTANSQTRRSSQTFSGTKSSSVLSNVTRTTPHIYETCNTMAIMARKGSLPPPVSPLSPSRSAPTLPPYPECVVCFRSLAGCRMYQDMYQCAQGHSLCADCHEREWLRGIYDLIESQISETDSSLPEYGAVTHTGNAVSETSRTEPLHHLRTEITANSRTRSSQTVSGTKSSLVSNNVTRTTPHTLQTRSILTEQGSHQVSHQVSRSLPVSPVSPVSQSAAPPAIPPCPECPVCFRSLAGSRIYQCAQGHSLCGDCNKNPQVKNCPTCRGKLMGRATNMEQLLASIYSGE